jgi:hypothetical protein
VQVIKQFEQAGSAANRYAWWNQSYFYRV